MLRIEELTKIKNDAIIGEDYDTAKESKLKIKEIYAKLELIIEKVDNLYPEHDSSSEEDINNEKVEKIVFDKKRKSKSPEKLKTNVSEKKETIKTLQKTQIKTDKSENNLLN